jgi:Type I phosphodiesterase / nucleotide pyrophosphatase
MLSAPGHDRMSLADVIPSCLDALGARPNRLGLRPVRRAVVVLADGLGVSALRARVGHARTLASKLESRAVIASGFPTTTAAALATLATGVLPGEHGLVGYTVLDQANDRVVNQLTGWDERLDPATWQRATTLFESATASGVEAVAVGHPRYATSGFTQAVLRGAEYRGGASIDDRFEIAGDWLRESTEPGLLYLYVPELDVAAHAVGWQSSQWIEQLENLDFGMRELSSRLGATHGAILTADHGVLDVPSRSHVFVDSEPSLVAGVRFVAGDPRCVQLHVDQDMTHVQRHRLVETWRTAEADRAWVASREQAIATGWFGAVADDVAPRMGDIFIVARKAIAYYDGRSASQHARAMVGQHGALSDDEVRVPLLRFGAFAL